MTPDRARQPRTTGVVRSPRHEAAAAGLAEPSDPFAPFRILHVCFGNVGRSVLADRLMRHGIAVRLRDQAYLFRSSSAGTGAQPGRPMHRDVARILRDRDANVQGFTTRLLTPAIIADSDLVLTASTLERDKVISLHPAALRRTFTLKEFARLAPLADVPDSGNLVMRARLIVTAALTFRGHTYVEPTDDDLPDPTTTPQGFEACAGYIARALDPVLETLLPRRGPSHRTGSTAN